MVAQATPCVDTMPTFLHVGCGSQYKDKTTRVFANWSEIRLDINEDVAPDIVGSMTDMSSVPSESVDAVFSSHTIEHLYAHEVPVALKEFLRVLKPTGFAVITCPDIQHVCELVAQDKLTDPAYQSPAGPIAPIDILWGHRGFIAAGNEYMAHKVGFTKKVLIGSLLSAGFCRAACARRIAPFYDLWAVASKSLLSNQDLSQLALAHFPENIE